ncbi:TRAP transporter permease [Martelella soudanensis]|uniref:TRAP transporter permease n=1 Tax=unclassified Martelella TaxID=2629616 RepID=UPI0015DE6982|nr:MULTISPECIES: TRAP transporter fused permease subunit [unclassified Martelella]
MTSDTPGRGATRLRTLLIFVLSSLLVGITAWGAVFGQLPNLQHRAIVLSLVAGLAVLVTPAGRGWAARGLDAVMLGVVLVASFWVYVNYWDIMMNPVARRPEAIILGLALVAAILELSRRAIGWTFAILIAIFAAYALFGDLLPGRIGHGGVSLRMLTSMLYLSTDGIWGQVFNIYASFLILFILFSALMMATGAGETMMDIAKLAGGRLRGGPAKISVISSAMIGSMTGSSVTNVAMTGTFTIPMMKRMGYRPEVAGAIEATASSGGQITPPLMGAGLFLMAEFLNVPVSHMMAVALMPALLFYAGVLASVHFESLREGVGALPAEEMPDATRLRRPSVWLPLAAPFVVLLAMLLLGYSVALSILSACVVLAGLHLLFDPENRGFLARLRDLASALVEAAGPLVMLGALCAAAGILIGVIGFVGIGVKFGDAMLGLAGGHLFPALILAGVVAIVIGMGMPTTAAYVLAASTILTSFDMLGVPALNANMFVFYFATLSAITPPVCTAVFVAAGLANASWWATAVQTVRFAVIKYLLPFLFIFRPETLLQGTPLDVAVTLAACLAGTVALSAGFSGWLVGPLHKWARAVTVVAGVLLLWPTLAVNLAGLVLVGVVILVTRRGRVTSLIADNAGAAK